MDDPTFRPAETTADLERLRLFVAPQGQPAPRDFDRHLARPRYRPALTRIAERDGAIVGCALLAHRRLRLGAATLEIGEIARLDTQEGEPGFTALLGDCLGTLLGEGLPLALVHGDMAIYSPYGFAPYTFSAEVDLDAGPHADTAPALRAASEADLDDLAALYTASYHDQPLAEARALPDWRARLADDYVTLVLEDGRARVIAYTAITTNDHGPTTSAPPVVVGRSSLVVAEAAAADAGAARSLIAALAAYAHASGLQRLRLRLAPAHIVAQAALHLGGTARIAAPVSAGELALAGVVDLPGILEALAPEFERRLAASRYAGWSGNLRVEIETERITLAFAAGRAAVIDGSRPADVRLRQVALPGLAQLCLGYRAAADLRATGWLACDDSALGLIDALFPVVMPFGD
jgi:predicted N-acetyltransferase YhbS